MFLGMYLPQISLLFKLHFFFQELQRIRSIVLKLRVLSTLFILSGFLLLVYILVIDLLEFFGLETFLSNLFRSFNIFIHRSFRDLYILSFVLGKIVYFSLGLVAGFFDDDWGVLELDGVDTLSS